MKKYRDIIRTVDKITNLLEYPHIFTLIDFNSEYLIAIFKGGELFIKQKDDEKKSQKDFLLLKNFKEFSITRKSNSEEDIHKKSRYLKNKLEIFNIKIEELDEALNNKLLELV